MSDRSQFNAEQFEAELAPVLLDIVRQTYLDLHRQPECGIRVTLDSSLDRELGFDSLARVELLTRVEGALGVALPEATLQTAETPRDLLAALHATSGKAGTVPTAAAGAVPAQTRRGAEAQAAEGTTLLEVLAW